MKDYGKELILDLHECSRVDRFNEKDIEAFMIELCDRINMVRQDLHFWYEDAESLKDEVDNIDHLIGTSAVQFIRTSNIVIHTLNSMKRVYLNIFTCKDFDPEKAKEFCLEYFGGKVVNEVVARRI